MPDDDYSKSSTADYRTSLVLTYNKLIRDKSDPPKRMAKDRDWIQEGPKKVGAPKGTRLDMIDAPLRNAMEREAAETKNFRPYRVARIVVKKTEMPEAEHEAAIRRLVRWWENPDRQN